MSGAKDASTLKEAPAANITGDGTHVAVARGFCEEVIEPGCVVPAGYPVGSWMEAVAAPAKSETKKAAASEE